MSPKLKQFGDEYSAIFQDASVVEAYGHRPPYPNKMFGPLAGLIDRNVFPCRVLDVGCGRGEMSSVLRYVVDGVDAVDVSRAMIEAGKQMSHGADPKIRWIVGKIEEVELNAPYALIVAAASIHWMEWEVTLPRLARVLSRDGYLALVETRIMPGAWMGKLVPILARYSMNKDFQPYNMLTISEELTRRNLFEQKGVHEIKAKPFTQSIEEWVETFHATNGFSRDRMDGEEADEFDRQVRELIVQFCPAGEVVQQIGARVIYGKPLG